ncbi:transglycosylase SLT domain-containing protein (plasmid) [Providencia alcalifaciens]|nr:transglycosylase SLT domain-containing protein [Providencia alcalifaciens]WGZ56461.1 transglycosylase SLT domain-containing protein [Providencia alcalifaciens]
MLYTSTIFAKDCINNAARDYQLDTDLLRAIAYRESVFKPNAINYVSPSSYAIGLMPIH